MCFGDFFMNVSVKFEKILETYDDYVSFAAYGKKFILKKNDFKMGTNRTIIVDYKVAKLHHLKWKLKYHIPAPIEPVYNQVCIDELRY